MWTSLRLYQLITLQLLFQEIRKCTINYFKKLAKEQKENKTLLENKLKELEGNLNKILFSHIIYTKKNLNLYMIISLKVLGFDQNMTGMNTAKSPSSFF